VSERVDIFGDGRAVCYLGDCLEVLPTFAAGSVDAVVTDPPYGLSFMGKDWDHGIPGVHFWTEMLRIAKPGAHLLAFGGTRTHHRLMCAIEDAGWEIRDTVMWVYGSGFPKSLDVSKAIDADACRKSLERSLGHAPTRAEFKEAWKGWREVVGYSRGIQVADNQGYGGLARGGVGIVQKPCEVPVTAPATPAAEQWEGWGTALKPAWEPIIVARKPLDGTVAANVLNHGTGGINVDGCRIGTDDCRVFRPPDSGLGAFGKHGRYGKAKGVPNGVTSSPSGRWPANLVHDGSEEVVGLFPQGGASGVASGPTRGKLGTQGRYGSATGENMGESCFYGDSGSAARFFYCAKASKADRDDGLRDGGVGGLRDGERANTAPRVNHHPTVKPTALMRWLVRLVTPPEGVVLDPFMGSGSTGKAAMLEGFRFAGIETGAEYFDIACNRLRAATDAPLFAAESET